MEEGSRMMYTLFIVEPRFDPREPEDIFLEYIKVTLMG
jgi:hypothetical protein